MNSVHQVVFPSKADYPLKVNFFSGKSGSDLFLRHHREVEIQFVKRGLGAYIIGRRRYRFGRNSVLIVKPHEKHRYMHWPGQYVEKIALIFSLRLINKRRRLPYRFPVHFSLSDKEAAEVEMRLRSIAEEKDLKEEYWREIISQQLKTLLIVFKRGANNLPIPGQGNPLVDKVQDYLDRHYNEPITIQMLSSVFHVSPSHIEHLFKNHVKTSIKQYVLWRRVLEAKTILTGNPSIKAVALAQMVGFKDYALFHRCFRRDTGVNLSTYRRISLAARKQ